MKREIQLSIGLTPNITFDDKSGLFVIFYEQFPQSIAAGNTEDEAEINLIHLLELMFKERKEELKEFLVSKLNDTQKTELGIKRQQA
jgi:predicted RNase H-like HicB family nuclease